FHMVPAMFSRIKTGCDEIRNLEWAVALNDFVSAAWDCEVKQSKRDQCAGNHDRSLNQIGPDDSLDATERGVNSRENDNGNGGTEVNPESLNLIRSSAADHFVGKSECDGCHIEPRSGREPTADRENSVGRMLTS